MSVPKLDWSTAAVKQATLTVELAGKPPSGWKQSFAMTVRLLGGGEWDEVTVKKQTIRVKYLVAGQEDKLRHFLDSVIDQANASRPGDPEPTRSEADAEADDSGGPDAEMTSRFRAFAGADTEVGSGFGSGSGAPG